MTTASDDFLLPSLEFPCESCDTRGTDWYTHDRCAKCGGSGHIPTEFGERVLDLMRHNIRLMCKGGTTE